MRKSSHEPVKAVRSWAVEHFWLQCFCFPEGGERLTGASRSEHLSLRADGIVSNPDAAADSARSVLTITSSLPRN